MLENFEKLLFANNITKFVKTTAVDSNQRVTTEDYKIEPILVTQSPTSFPKNIYKDTLSLATLVNKLMYKLSQDNHVEQSDDLISLLTKIKKVKKRKAIDVIFLRTDYLLDGDKPVQVEINTMSCAFLFLGPKVNKVHKQYYKDTLVSNSDNEFINMVKEVLSEFLASDSQARITDFDDKNDTRNIVYNKNACSSTPKLKKQSKNSKTSCLQQKPVFLMIDDKTDISSANFFEKIEIIKRMKENDIDVVHTTYDELKNNIEFVKSDNSVITKQEMDKIITKKLEQGKKLHFDFDVTYKGRKVFFVYYRWFYNFCHYKESDVLLRAQLECSTAVSLPTVDLQIVGSKLFQIKMKDKEYLRRFIDDDEINQMYKYFGDFKQFSQYEKGDERQYILKSVNEGGGNNIFGEDIPKFSGDRSKMFLMKTINSPTFANKFLKDLKSREIIPEIGIMGWALIKNGLIVCNKDAGYICRSKDKESKECGVSCGFGALDSIYE